MVKRILGPVTAEQVVTFLLLYALFGKVIILLTCFLYAIYRVAAFHPLFRPGYATWLRATPWIDVKQLPLGSLYLTLHDGVILLLLLSFAGLGGANTVALALIFAFTFLMMHAIAFIQLKQYAPVYALAFGLGFFVRFDSFPFRLGLLTAMFVISYIGISHSLKSFPWPDTGKLFNSRRGGSVAANRLMGWPFEALTPCDPSEKISAVHGILISLLTGWWIYVLRYSDQLIDLPKQCQSASALIASASVMIAMIRVFMYLRCTKAPISFFGRIFTGRWIIPRYDVIFVSPLLIVLLGKYAAPVLISSMVLLPSIAAGLLMAGLLMLAMLMGPTVTNFNLTGANQLVRNPQYTMLR